MTDSTRMILKGLSLAGFLLVGLPAIQVTQMSDMNVWAGSRSSNKGAAAQGDADRGRAIFNGKGICYYCHGVDGRPDQRPQLDQETASVVARLSPIPVDLRNPKMLKLKSDRERSRAIREGHPGTGMLPDTTLTDQEIRDTLAYLALLRREGYSNKR